MWGVMKIQWFNIKMSIKTRSNECRSMKRVCIYNKWIFGGNLNELEIIQVQCDNQKDIISKEWRHQRD